MKKIQSNFILLAFICITINIFGQRSNFPIEHQRNRNGEFIERRPDDFDDIRNATKRCCENPNNTELGDFSFSWGNGSFNNLLANDRLVKEAARRRLNNWYNRQVNEIIKPAIEYRYNKKFANFEDAKNYLFKISEENKSYVNLPKTTNKYANLKSKGQSKEKGHLMSLKLLSFREKEIRNGKINNSFYGDKKINGVLLKNIRSVNAVKTLWDTQVDLFTKNTIIYNNNKNILHKLRNLDSDFYKEATRQKNNYYNTFSAWDKLNFMQVLINYDEYDAKKLRPDANLLFFEFENIIISTPEFIENYAIKHSEKYNSIFTNNCLSYYRIFGWKGYKTKSKRDHECEKAKLAELDKKINETSIGSNLSVDFLVDYTGLITGEYQLQWLNDNPNKAIAIAKKMQVIRNKYKRPFSSERKDLVLKAFKEDILPIISKGALTSKLIEELGITSYQDSKKRHFLYNNQTEADELIKFANENKVNGKITSKALAYIKGQVEVDRILDGQFKIKSTGKHPQELNNCCPGGCCPDSSYDNDKIIHEYGIEPIQSAIDGTFNNLVAVTELIGSDKWVGSRIRKIMTKVGVQVPPDVKNEYLAAVYRIRKRDGVLIVEYRPGLLKNMLDVGLDTLDIISFLSPSKGGGAFLGAQTGITITKITAHIKKITINNTKINSAINSIKNNSKFDLIGTGQYNVVKGHHPLAKIAFKGDDFYNFKKAFSVSSNKLQEVWDAANLNLPSISVHSKITGQQNSLYSAFKKTGEVLTLNKMAEIEIKAMVNIGIPENIAKGWVIKSLENLKEQGVKMITNIPWNGLN
ncbi:hypothetical protein [Tenacibaculum finnmarkense]|uniref:hypothetical protein n=2 Tax=Tenacibaculum finnmarkense TaxID=2781243 RepID=UPI00187B75A6|nr:hypothetical protein [Tenacibaculum finnmarkense]MBE7659942.1 hypothetical protein [Tenacibaculum finnmarkense genomovar finnmarkense]MCG8251628.1 hypothetical protein [Tenacibaculum finnmarkense genomovar finnmarkense]MCG8815156.1 hypothetical protein [Tenacibaculum finnmarkense]MCG8820181.1 hypothetical protein [Tenacibaculum finnmarkense]MCG8900553.1 hypothetical protein [Tenacibaculum finnmarkense]